MITLEQNINNEIIIANDGFATGQTYSFEIENDLSKITTNFDLTASTENDRYLSFNFDVVDSKSDENLPTDVYLDKGSYNVEISLSGTSTSIYTDIARVAFSEPNISGYTYDNSTDNVFVYNK